MYASACVLCILLVYSSASDCMLLLATAKLRCKVCIPLHACRISTRIYYQHVTDMTTGPESTTALMGLAL